MIKIKNPSQEPTVSLKAPNINFDMYVLCTFKIKIGSQNSDYGRNKDQWLYTNQDQDSKPKSGTSSDLQSPKSGLQGHGSSLHLQNQDREPKFGSWLYKRPLTISISRSRQQTPVRNLQCPLVPNIRIKGYGSSLHLQNQDRELKFVTLMHQRPATISKSRSRCRTPARFIKDQLPLF